MQLAAVWVLAIDTSGPNGGIALARDGQLVETVDIAATDGFGEVLFQQIDALLQRHGLRAANVACFAAACGPGSFTGLRVALAAAMGLAEGTGGAAIGVSNLQAVAWHGTGEVRAPYLDARRGEFYGGLYDAQLRPLAEETVMALERWRAGLPEGAELITYDHSLAPAVAAIAYERYLSGDGKASPVLEANYVRRSDAEMNWKDDRARS